MKDGESGSFVVVVGMKADYTCPRPVLSRSYDDDDDGRMYLPKYFQSYACECAR